MLNEFEDKYVNHVIKRDGKSRTISREQLGIYHDNDIVSVDQIGFLKSNQEATKIDTQKVYTYVVAKIYSPSKQNMRLVFSKYEKEGEGFQDFFDNTLDLQGR